MVKLEAKLSARDKEVEVHKSRLRESQTERSSLESQLSNSKDELDAMKQEMKDKREEDDEYGGMSGSGGALCVLFLLC